MSILNVAEKPSVAKGISDILSQGNRQSRQGFSRFNPVYEFTCRKRVRDAAGSRIDQTNGKMIFTSVAGHMMNMEFQEIRMRGWRSCDPIELFQAKIEKKISKGNNCENIAKTLRKEARGCRWLILWLDCDREGENIASEVEQICLKANRRLVVLRAVFSAVIPREIHRAIVTLRTIDTKQSEAVDARSEIDLRLGAAFTRWMTLRLQRMFPILQSKIISYGPCQFPTLGFIVDRVRRIEAFVREKFWYIEVTDEREASSPSDGERKPTTKPNAERTTFKWKRGRVFDRHVGLVLFEQCTKKPEAVVLSVSGREKRKYRPLPLDTIELQKRASRCLRFSSEKTMKVAEKLYQSGFMSYPRTETNRFPKGFDIRGIVQELRSSDSLGAYAGRLLDDGCYREPRQGPKDDKAHPPIHPTKVPPAGSVGPDEMKLYDFVARYFLACCSDDAIGQQTTVVIDIAAETFTTWGLMIKARNFLDIFPFERWNARTVPLYRVGDRFVPKSCMMLEGETAPPSLINEANLIGLMDKNGIGTDATIADHIAKVCNVREYAKRVRRDFFEPTPLGRALCDAFDSMGRNDLAKPYLRANMESACKDIVEGRRERHDVVNVVMAQMRTVYQQMTRNAAALTGAVGTRLNVQPSSTTSNAGSSATLPPPPSSEMRTVRRKISTCGHCGLEMQLVAATISFRGSPSVSHYVKCSSNRCKTENEGNPRFLQLPKRSKAFKPTEHTCPICRFQVLSAVRGSDHAQSSSSTSSSYHVCPWCYTHPVGDVGDIENVGDVPGRDTMPCFTCPAIHRCTLAGGSAGPAVGLCPSCGSGSLRLKRGTTNRGGSKTTYRLDCTNRECRHRVYLPAMARSVAVADELCSICSSAPLAATEAPGGGVRKLSMRFARRDVPPSMPLSVTVCAMSDSCCRSLRDIGMTIQFDASQKRRSSMPPPSSAIPRATLRDLDENTSGGRAESGARMRRPSILQRSKKRARSDSRRGGRSTTTTTRRGGSNGGRSSHGGGQPTGGPVPSCPGHGLPCVLRHVKKDGANKGRPFYTCSKDWNDRCKIFQWADE